MPVISRECTHAGNVSVKTLPHKKENPLHHNSCCCAGVRWMPPQWPGPPGTSGAVMTCGRLHRRSAVQGTIDNHATYLIFDSVALLAGSESWTRDDQAALFLWFSKYIHHLQSDHCRSESLQENNHGTFFDVQYLSIVSFLRRCGRSPIHGSLTLFDSAFGSAWCLVYEVCWLGRLG